MIDYEKLYVALFNGITDAMEDMDKQNYGLAKDKFRNMQQEAEDVYINVEE